MPTFLVFGVGILTISMLLFTATAQAGNPPDERARETAAGMAERAVHSGGGEAANNAAALPATRDEWTKQGRSLYDAGRFEESRDAWIVAARMKEDDAEAWLMLGRIEFELGDFRRAWANLQRSLTLGLDDRPELLRTARIYTGMVLNRGRQPEFAIEQLAGASAKTTDEPPLLILAYGLAGLEWPKAPRELTAEERPVVELSGKAQLLFARRQMEAAAKLFDEFVAKYPNTPGVNYSTATFLLNSDRERAVRLFKREIELRPDHYKSRIQIAYVLMKDGQNEAALPFAEEAAKLAPQFFPAHNALGQVLINLDQPERAVEVLQHAVKLEPASPDVRYQLGRALKAAGRDGEAEAQFEQFKKLDAERRAR